MTPSALALAALATASTAGAAEREGPVDPERFHAGTSRAVTVQGGDAAAEGELKAAAVVHFADEALGVYDADGKRVGSLLDDRLALDVAFAYGVLERVEVGVYVPVIFSQAAQVGGEGFVQRTTPTALETVGVGDPALAVRFKAASASSAGLDVVLSASATAPVSGGANFLGEPHATVTPKVGLGRAVGTNGWLGLDLGFRAREDRDDFYGLPVGDEVVFGVAATTELFEDVHGIAEVYGATLATAPFDPQTTPVEALGAAKLGLGGGVSLLAGGAAGLTSGYGAPVFRAFLGATFGTGGETVAAACEHGPEDFDGYQDDDGCADPDDDGDGIADAVDRCPDAPGGGADADRDGCPDADDPLAGFRSQAAGGDADGDGIADAADLCAKEREDADGFQDDDGCADADNDADGIPDGTDACPSSAGVPAKHGCPELGGAR